MRSSTGVTLSHSTGTTFTQSEEKSAMGSAMPPVHLPWHRVWFLLLLSISEDLSNREPNQRGACTHFVVDCTVSHCTVSEKERESIRAWAVVLRLMV